MALFDQDTIHKFMNGMCYPLAIRIHETLKTGSIRLINLFDIDGKLLLNHAFHMSTDEMTCIDIRGIHTFDKFIHQLYEDFSTSHSHSFENLDMPDFVKTKKFVAYLDSLICIILE